MPAITPVPKHRAPGRPKRRPHTDSAVKTSTAVTAATRGDSGNVSQPIARGNGPTNPHRGSNGVLSGSKTPARGQGDLASRARGNGVRAAGKGNFVLPNRYS